MILFDSSLARNTASTFGVGLGLFAPITTDDVTTTADDPWAEFDGWRYELGPEPAPDDREPAPDPKPFIPTEADNQYLVGFDRGFASDYMAFSAFPHGSPERLAFEAGFQAGLDNRPWVRAQRAEDEALDEMVRDWDVMHRTEPDPLDLQECNSTLPVVSHDWD